MATYYVDTTTGDNGDSGATEALAFATIDYALDQLAAGGSDKIWVKGSANYNEDASTLEAGSLILLSGHTVEGYTTTPGDGGTVTVDGESTRAHGITINDNGYIWKNFTVIGCTGDGFYSPGADYIQLHNCHSTSNGGMGFRSDNYAKYINCTATSNTSHGFDADIGASFYGCLAKSNGGWGIQVSTAGAQTTVHHCILTNNTTGQLQLDTGQIIHCTFDGKNAQPGVTFLAYANEKYDVINNIFYDCTTAIIGPSSLRGVMHVSMNNVFYSNTTNYTYWQDQGTDIFTDPVFTSSSTYDYSLDTGSSAIGTGYQPFTQNSEYLTDCGAIQTLATAAGGGRVVYAG